MQRNDTMQRRDFLAQAAAGGTAGLVAAGPLAALASGDRGGDAWMFRLTVDDFAPLVGDRFEFRGSGEQRVSARLVEARAMKDNGSRPTHLPRSESFSLVFQTDGGEPLVQETRAVRHPDLGALPMLLVPISPRGRSQRVEAVFN